MTKYFSEKELKELLSNEDFDKVLKDSGSKPVLVTINNKHCSVKKEEQGYKVVEGNTDDWNVNLQRITSNHRTKK